MKLVPLFALPVAAAALGAWLVVGRSATDGDAGAASVGPVDIAAGEALYGDYCASCHGANIEGQEDWRSPGTDGRLPAPPHDDTGHTWHHPDSVLFAYTKLGGKAALEAQGISFDSGMPGFGDQLSDQQIRDILGYIRSTWPDRIQDVQRQRTQDDTRAKEGDT